jgi:hypothetical protein
MAAAVSLCSLQLPARARPDIANLSIADLGAASEGGSYNGMSWQAGQAAADLLRLGSLAETALPDLSVGRVFAVAGFDPKAVSLTALPAVSSLTLQELVRVVPKLGSRTLLQVPPVQALVARSLGALRSRTIGSRTLAQLAENPQLGGLRLAQLTELDRFSIASIPGLTAMPLRGLPNWQSIAVSEVPGLASLPFRSILGDLPQSIPLAILDVVFSEAEGYRADAISGSYQEGFQVACNQPNCAHIELGEPHLGRQWISGRSQWVRGGSGCLSGSEPTGRHPFGSAFKVVLTDTDEASGSAEFSLYFRFSLFCGTSPYIIGPFPFYRAAEKDTIIVGF